MQAGRRAGSHSSSCILPERGAAAAAAATLAAAAAATGGGGGVAGEFDRTHLRANGAGDGGLVEAGDDEPVGAIRLNVETTTRATELEFG